MRRAGFLALAAVPLLLPLAAATGPGQQVEVTAPTSGSEHRSGSSVLVTWHNGTGQEVDMWLVHGGDKVRVSQLAAKVSAAASGEKATVLPDVRADKGYAIEVAAHDGGKRGYSPAFTVTDANQGPPSHHRPVSSRLRPCLTLPGCPETP